MIDIRQRLRRMETRYTFEDLAGCSPSFLALVQTAKSAALTPASILIEGESGTGKSMLAQAIHNASRRRTQSFVSVDCAARGELLENELADLVKEATRGTLYMANVDSISREMQRKLLTAMASREVRLLSSTKTPLSKMADAGFSSELLTRLRVFHLPIPPLRERIDDVAEIAMYFINLYNAILDRRISGIDSAAVELLKAQAWPGNVRELENVLSKTIVNMDGGSEQIQIINILNFLENSSRNAAASSQAAFGSITVRLADAVNATERAHIANALAQGGGDKNKAAAALDIPLRTLYYKCKKLGIM
ncbi:MAG: sigma 54-interacting transcriptional regulator [Clostridiales bacterium]|nr:sigma 54-interacting transcriptional regulator [Clostridiales bacterium]